MIYFWDRTSWHTYRGPVQPSWSLWRHCNVMKLSSLVGPEVVIVTIHGAASDENSIKMSLWQLTVQTVIRLCLICITILIWFMLCFTIWYSREIRIQSPNIFAPCKPICQKYNNRKQFSPLSVFLISGKIWHWSKPRSELLLWKLSCKSVNYLRIVI